MVSRGFDGTKMRPRADKGEIRIYMAWYEANKDSIPAEDRDYLNSITTGHVICPRIGLVQDTERARKILRIEES